MKIPLLVRGRGLHASSADRLRRFRKVLKSAQRKSFYHHSLRSAGLHTRRSIQQLESIEATLPRLAVCDRDARRPAIRVRYNPKGALLDPLPALSEISLCPPAGNDPHEIIAGSYHNLFALAGKVTVERALIVITGIQEAILNSHHRNVLWNAFGVPIFEQCLGLDGQLIAHECEAHDGLHIVQHNAVLEAEPEGHLLLTSLTDLREPTLRLRTGFSGTIRMDACECGRTQPRLTGLSAQPVR